MDCKRIVTSKIPSFDEIWPQIKNDDRWKKAIDHEYRQICKERGIECPGITERQEAIEIVKMMAKGVYGCVIDVLDHFYHEETMEVFRAMRVENIENFVKTLEKHKKSIFKGELVGVGIYWAWDESHAVVYTKGEGEEDVVLVARVKCDDVDIPSTVYSYMTFGTAMNCTDEDNENEITLYEGRKIVLEEIRYFRQKMVSMPMHNIEIWT